MIDEKKIEEAAKNHLYGVRAAYRDTDIDGYAYPTAIRDIEQQCMDDFSAGAHWAIDEFLKGLWHPVSEEPKEKNGKCLILRNDGLVVTYGISCVKHMIFHFGGESAGWKSWCYLDDLLPKKGDSDERV